MKVESSARIDGVFKGDLLCSGLLTISKSSEVHAHLEGNYVYVNGIVRGTVRAQKVQLDAHAQLTGDIYASTLVIAEGAIFHGSSMKFEEKELEARQGKAALAVSDGRDLGGTEKEEIFRQSPDREARSVQG